MSYNDASAHNFEGYETPKSSRAGGRGLSVNGDTLNRENNANRVPSMNEVIIENQNVEYLDTVSEGHKKKLNENTAANSLQTKKSLVAKYDYRSLYIFK